MKLKQSLIVVCMWAVGLLAVSVASATTPDAPATLSTDLVPWFEMLASLVGGEKAAQWFGLIGIVCYVLNHVRAWVPARYIAKLPRFLVWFIEVFNANYGGAKNEPVNRTTRSR